MPRKFKHEFSLELSCRLTFFHFFLCRLLRLHLRQFPYKSHIFTITTGKDVEWCNWDYIYTVNRVCVSKSDQSIILSWFCLTTLSPIFIVALIHHLHYFFVDFDNFVFFSVRPLRCLLSDLFLLLFVLALIHLLVFRIVLHRFDEVISKFLF